ncbi:MAG: hypothetical protein ABIQ73_28140 [Acidimicrobiales bacterium]
MGWQDRGMPLPFVLAASDLVDKWRDVGPVLWFVAAGAVALWIMVLIVLALQSEPRRVSEGPPTLDLGGAERPAIVNLVTSDWVLGRQSVPATLLDLAARRFVSIDWIGERTLVRVREHGPDDGQLVDYERLVLEHIRTLSQQTGDGFVPADALTTGPEDMSTRWWRQFESSVVHDARERGLSRPRWGARARSILTAMAIVVGLSVGVAATTLPTDSKDDDPIGAAIGFAVLSAAVLIAVASKLRGERDTTDGRAASTRWLGLRSMLANDPTFATQPPAAVNIWDRIMSYGAAMGVARTAVETLPFGSESERQAWSPVGNRWRVVRIRYPRRIPPGYGRHPAFVALLGLVATAVGVSIAPAAISLANAILRSIDDLATDHTVPVGVRAAVGVVLALIVTIGALLAAFGVGMLVAGVGDLVRRRRDIEGRVLRIRERGDDEHRFWHVAVDDGTSDRIRAWRMKSAPAYQGATIRARVSPWLRHVDDFSMILADDGRTAVTPASGATTGAAAVSATAPPLLDAAAVGAALGWPVDPAPTAIAHPLAIDGASRTFLTHDGGRIITAWIAPAQLDEFRRMPAAVATPITGVGEEAFHSVAGGGLVARLDGHVLMVSATLPSLDDAQRDRVVVVVAQSTLANVRSR